MSSLGIKNSVDFKGIPIGYTAYGRPGAPVLLVLPGFLETRSSFDFVAQHWAKRFRVVTVDLIGHGDSGNLGYVHTMRDFAEAAWAVLRHLHIRFFRVAGHSLGGYIALELIALMPHRLRGVLLLNTHPFADSEERKRNRRRAMALAKQARHAYVGAAITALVDPSHVQQLTAELEKMHSEARGLTVQGIIAAQEGMMQRVDRRDLLAKRWPFPIVVVAGHRDPIIPLSLTESYWALPAITSRCLHSGGHLSFLEDPKVLIKATSYI